MVVCVVVDVFIPCSCEVLPISTAFKSAIFLCVFVRARVCTYILVGVFLFVPEVASCICLCVHMRMEGKVKEAGYRSSLLQGGPDFTRTKSNWAHSQG